MDESDIVGGLSTLHRLAEDLARAYGEALERIDDEDVREGLRRIEGDHRAHARDVERLMETAGLQPIESEHASGELLRALRHRIADASSTTRILRDLELAERAAVDEYADVLFGDIGGEARRTLEHDAGEDRAHIRYLGTMADACAPARSRRTRVRWGTGGYGTGDQFGGGESEGAGGFPSAGPSYSGGEDDLTTGD